MRRLGGLFRSLGGATSSHAFEEVWNRKNSSSSDSGHPCSNKKTTFRRCLGIQSGTGCSAWIHRTKSTAQHCQIERMASSGLTSLLCSSLVTRSVIRASWRMCSHSDCDEWSCASSSAFRSLDRFASSSYDVTRFSKVATSILSALLRSSLFCRRCAKPCDGRFTTQLCGGIRRDSRQQTMRDQFIASTGPDRCLHIPGFAPTDAALTAWRL